MFGLRAWRRRRFLARQRLPAAEWAAAQERLPLLGGLAAAERDRLGALALLFLREKAIEGAGGFRPTPAMVLDIALLASLPVMNLGIEWLEGWISLVLYADEFVVEHEEMDEMGVVHRFREARAGETWARGPLILSWRDVAASRALDGYNVVLHEVAHKLDAGDGSINGMPPLHRDMAPTQWAATLQAAFDALALQVAMDARSAALDPYALNAPAEFFAVASETFFERPNHLRGVFPQLYEQLSRFYRQDPAQRLAT